MSFLFGCCGGNKKGQYYEVTSQKDGKVTTQYINDIKKVKDLNSAQRVIRVEKSEYQELLKKYKGDKKWTDPTFSPGSESLGKIQNVPNDCEWKRISEILNAPQLFDGKIEPRDVIQGSLGDCYFLSAISALAEKQGRIANVFGNQKYNPNGVYKVQLRVDGVIKEILIDDFVPVNRAGKPLFCQPNKNQFWVILLEKAWAKANGSYANIAAGTPTQVLKAMTYAPCELKPIKQQIEEDFNHPKSVWGDIAVQAYKNNPMCAGTKISPSIQWSSVGLVEGHAYTLLDAVTLSSQVMNDQRMVKLRNPWGQKQWSGKGNQNDEEFWSNVDDTAEKRKFIGSNQNGNDGVFYMAYQDFCHYFNEVHLCHLLEKPMYEVEPMFCDKVHGSIYSFEVKQADEYMFELHQDTIRGEDKQKIEAGLNRSTLLLAEGKNYQFLDGSLKYHEEDNTLRTQLSPGQYYLYSKIDPTVSKNLIPENLSVSCYSNHLVNLNIEDKKKHPDFFKKVFMTYAHGHKRKQYGEGKMWISWKLFFEKGGFAFLAFGVEPGHNRKFVITFDQKDFNDSNYILKKPHKGKGKQTIQVNPGEEEIVVVRVKNGPLAPMKFPPPIDIQIDGF